MQSNNLKLSFTKESPIRCTYTYINICYNSETLSLSTFKDKICANRCYLTQICIQELDYVNLCTVSLLARVERSHPGRTPKLHFLYGGLNELDIFAMLFSVAAGVFAVLIIFSFTQGKTRAIFSLNICKMLIILRRNVVTFQKFCTKWRHTFQ